MRKLLFILFIATLAGCSNTQQVLVTKQEATIDSLAIANARLRQQVFALQDSLRFYDEIDSGFYYRKQRLLEDEINKLNYALNVCRDGGTTLATLLADDLFEPGTATLTPQGMAHLDQFIPALQGRQEGQVIRIEGHTDSVPVGPTLAKTYPTNWELSAGRATSVARYLMDQHGLPADRIEAVGMGASHPAARNDLAEGRRQNRRVRIALR